MFAYEIWFVDGSVLTESGFLSFFDAECAMIDIIDNSDIGVDYERVMEVE